MATNERSFISMGQHDRTNVLLSLGRVRLMAAIGSGFMALKVIVSDDFGIGRTSGNKHCFGVFNDFISFKLHAMILYPICYPLRY